MTPHSRRIAGLLLLSIVAIESGGYYMTRIVSGHVEVTDFQLGFSRAGHAHAGMLVTLSLVALLVADAGNVSGRAGWVARLGVPVAAILMPAGFFFSSMGAGRTEPNPLIVLLWLGAASLTVGVLTLGVSLLKPEKAPVSAPPR